MDERMEGEIKKTLDKVWVEWPWEKALPREQLFNHAATEINKLFEKELQEQLLIIELSGTIDRAIG